MKQNKTQKFFKIMINFKIEIYSNQIPKLILIDLKKKTKKIVLDIYIEFIINKINIKQLIQILY